MKAAFEQPEQKYHGWSFDPYFVVAAVAAAAAVVADPQNAEIDLEGQMKHLFSEET